MNCVEQLLVVNEKTKINLYPLLSPVLKLDINPTTEDEIIIVNQCWKCIGYSLLYSENILINEYMKFLNDLLVSLNTYPWKVVESQLFILEKYMRIKTHSFYSNEFINSNIFNNIKDILDKFTKYKNLTLNCWRLINTMVNNDEIYKEKEMWLRLLNNYINDTTPEIAKIANDCISILNK